MCLLTHYLLVITFDLLIFYIIKFSFLLLFNGFTIIFVLSWKTRLFLTNPVDFRVFNSFCFRNCLTLMIISLNFCSPNFFLTFCISTHTSSSRWELGLEKNFCTSSFVKSFLLKKFKTSVISLIENFFLSHLLPILLYPFLYQFLLPPITLCRLQLLQLCSHRKHQVFLTGC